LAQQPLLAMSTLSLAEAFAAIPLAAVCCDQRFAAEEAKLIREQLLTSGRRHLLRHRHPD